jgi:hypothetical protein
MKAAEILGLGAVRFIEPSFADLIDDACTARLEQSPALRGRLLLDEASDPLALALEEEGGWIAGSFLYRRPTSAVIQRFEDTNGDIYQEDREIWAAAVRDYFAREILATVTPAIDDLNPARSRIIEQLIRSAWGERPGVTCLDCCCGSGVGSMVLRRLGMKPLSYDNDTALLSLGLRTGRLLPGETMCIDGTLAVKYTAPVPLGIGLMFGEIHAFNQEMWEAIVHALLVLTQEALITVGTEKEARLVEEWSLERRHETRVFENPADPIYDRWVIAAKGGEPGKLG